MKWLICVRLYLIHKVFFMNTVLSFFLKEKVNILCKSLKLRNQHVSFWISRKKEFKYFFNSILYKVYFYRSQLNVSSKRYYYVKVGSSERNKISVKKEWSLLWKMFKKMIPCLFYQRLRVCFINSAVFINSFVFVLSTVPFLSTVPCLFYQQYQQFRVCFINAER